VSETLDRAYLEYAEITSARTVREVAYQFHCIKALYAIAFVRECCGIGEKHPARAGVDKAFEEMFNAVGTDAAEDVLRELRATKSLRPLPD
jgi:hypothetical protein